MPTSSEQVEDIFEAAGTADVTPVALEPTASAPAAESVEPVTVPRRLSRRLILVIAICLVALLLLSGIGFGVWLWLQQEPALDEDTSVVVNETVVTVPENVNTTTDTTTPPVNTNTAPVLAFVDTDHDGLSDDEELVENTNPKKKDTDEDGLSDREEVRVYDTDPRNPDTDGDGYTDGNEVTHFYHPNSPDPKKRLFDLPQ